MIPCIQCLIGRTALKLPTAVHLHENDIICTRIAGHPDKCGIQYDKTHYWGGFNHWIIKYDPAFLRWDVPRDEDGFLDDPQLWVVVAQPYTPDWFICIREGLVNDGLTDTERKLIYRR